MASPTTPVVAAASAPSPTPAATPAPISPPPAPATPPSPPAAPETRPGAPADPGTAAPPAPYDPKTAPAPPKNTDYANTPDGQIEFLKQHKAWETANPDGKKPAGAAPPAEAAPKTPEEQALADAVPLAKAAEAAPPEAAATPQSLSELMKENPEFGKALEASPKAKGQIFQMARKLAEAEPITAIVPTIEDAKFMQEYTTNMVGLKTASMRMIDNPDGAGAFLDLFDSQFQRVDGEGKPILDAAGKPTFDPDRDAVRGAIFNARLQEVTQPMVAEIASLKTKLAGAYPSDFARQQDQQRLDNLEYAQTAMDIIPQILDGSFFEAGAPEVPTDATPEVKAYFEQQKAELDRKRQEFDDKQRGASKEERAAQTQTFNTNVRTDMGTSVGTVIGTALKAITDSGVYIPEFYMQEKYVDPATGKETSTSAIGARLFLQFENEIMRPGSRTLLDIVGHELLPQNDQTREMRKTWYARQAAQIMPGLVQKEVDRIQSLVKLDQQKQDERLKKQREVAQPEPSTGGSSLPQGASREQILAAAEEAAKKDPGWAEANPTERQARILTQVHRMGKK